MYTGAQHTQPTDCFSLLFLIIVYISYQVKGTRTQRLIKFSKGFASLPRPDQDDTPPLTRRFVKAALKTTRQARVRIEAKSRKAPTPTHAEDWYPLL